MVYKNGDTYFLQAPSMFHFQTNHQHHVVLSYFNGRNEDSIQNEDGGGFFSRCKDPPRLDARFACCMCKDQMAADGFNLGWAH